MKEQITTLLNEVEQFATDSKEQIEAFRIKILGSKGVLKDLFAEFKNVPNEQKKKLDS